MRVSGFAVRNPVLGPLDCRDAMAMPPLRLAAGGLASRWNSSHSRLHSVGSERVRRAAWGWRSASIACRRHPPARPWGVLRAAGYRQNQLTRSDGSNTRLSKSNSTLPSSRGSSTPSGASAAR